MSNEIKLAFAHPSQRAQATQSSAIRDRISLRDHIREVDIGAFQAERGTTQRICFNVVVEVGLPDMSDVVQTDDVDKILSYDAITDAIDRELSSERLNLLETLAVRVAEDILSSPLAARVFVRIEKLDRGPGALGVEIVRDREAVSLVQPDEEVRPCVVFLSNDVIGSSKLSQVLDKLERLSLPLILCVGTPDVGVPGAEHSMAQRRINLLAQEQNAWVLAGRDKRCVVVATRTELDWAMKNGQISVWAPSKIVLDATDDRVENTADPYVLTKWFAQEFESQKTLAIGDFGAAPQMDNLSEADFLATVD